MTSFTEKKRNLVHLTKATEDDRRGRKAGAKLLKRAIPTASMCAGTLHHSNKSFYLIISSKKAICGFCQNDILYRTKNMLDRLCFRHNERYKYPLTFGPDGKTWETTGPKPKRDLNYLWTLPQAIFRWNANHY